VDDRDNPDAHVSESLGLYVLGGLAGPELLAVQQHLTRCADCCAESADLSEVPIALNLLSADERRRLSAEPPAP
jgi:hypothetical protein